MEYSGSNHAGSFDCTGIAPHMKLPSNLTILSPSTAPSSRTLTPSPTILDSNVGSIVNSEGSATFRVSTKPEGSLISTGVQTEPIPPQYLTVPDSSKPKSKISNTRKALLLAVFCMAQFLDAVNNSSLYPPLPTIGTEFGMTTAEQQWMFSAYALTFSSFLLLSGRIADISSPKWTFITGLSVLSLMSLIAGFVPNKIALIVLRALQGIGAALTIPSSLSLLVWTFPNEKTQSQAIAIFSGMTAIGIVLGLLVGAVFTSQVSWKWCFWFITCIGVPTLVASIFLIPAEARDEDGSLDVTGRTKTKVGVDFIGVSLLTIAMILFVFGLTSGPATGWGAAQVWAPVVLSIVLLGAFLFWETRIPERDAALPPSMWFYPNFAVLFGLALLPFGWLLASCLSFTELWQSSYGISSLETAVRFLPLVIPTGIVTTLLAIFPGTSHPKRGLLIGFFLMIAGTALLPFARGLDNYWRILFPAWILGSTGDALVIVYCSTAMFRATPKDRSGLTGAALNSSLQLGLVVVTAALTGITPSVNTRFPGDPFNGVSASFWFLFGCVVLETAIAVVLYREKSPSVAKKDVEQALDSTTTNAKTSGEKEASLSTGSEQEGK